MASKKALDDNQVVPAATRHSVTGPQGQQVTPSQRQAVTSADDRKVTSYKILPTIARRLRKYAHDTDRPIAHVAEQAFIEFLEKVGG